MARVTAPQSMASVLAIPASLDSRKLAPRMAPASTPVRAPKASPAPQAQAAAASMAPSRDGTR